MTIPEVLAAHKENYGNPEVHLASEERDVFITSDLHLAAGRSRDGRYRGTENFFADEAFVRFLKYAKSASQKKPILIINGDFIDFLRIKEVPFRDESFDTWQAELDAIGIKKTTSELKSSVSKKEAKYGLKTNDFKSIWKLFLVSAGHKELFEGLAQWIADGNTLIITKGNHDLEWYFPRVRQYFAYRLALHIAASKGIAVEVALKQILDSLTFIDDALVFDKTCYIEHGHRYDKFSYVVGDPLWKGSDELNIPFGSFFNRYLINRIELVYPYLDNIKPSENLLPLLIRERFPLALKVLFQHIPFLVKIIPKRYYRYMFLDVLVYFVTLGIPLAVSLYIIYKSIAGDFVMPPAEEMSPIVAQIIEASKSVGWMIGSYVLTRIVAHFRLAEPSNLSEFAENKFAERPELKLITMGHTHHADQFVKDDKKFFNTGTWIPIIETSSGNVSHDRTFVFLHLTNKNGSLTAESLARWNDDALRPDPLVLINKKED